MVLCCYALFVVILSWLFDWFVMPMCGVWILAVSLGFADGLLAVLGCCRVVQCLVFVLVCVGCLLLSGACLMRDLVAGCIVVVLGSWLLVGGGFVICLLTLLFIAVCLVVGCLIVLY